MPQFTFGSPSRPHFEFLGGINCNICGRYVGYQPCKSQANGNYGRPVAVCQSLDKNGKACNFIRWKPGFSRTPSPTAATQERPSAEPPLLLSELLPHALGTLVLPTTTQSTTSAITKEICLAVGCKSSRIRQDCRRRQCKKHCREAGGCLSPPHLVNNATAAHGLASSSTIPTPPSLAIVSTATTMTHPVSQYLPPPTTIAATHPMPVPSSADPVFASHMTPIFTQRMAEEQELHEKRRKQELMRLENARKAEHTITIYAWTEEDVDPMVVKIQTGFTWPYFEVSAGLLVENNITIMPSNKRIMLFDLGLGIWTSVGLPHVMMMNNQLLSVFMKPCDLISVKDLPRYAKFPTYSVPSMRINLAGERAYIRDRMAQRELELLTPTRPQPYAQSLVSSRVAPSTASQTKIRRTVKTSLPSLTSTLEISSDDDSSDEEQDYHLPIPLDLQPIPIKSEPLDVSAPAVSKVWPADFYAVDIIACFDEVRSLRPGTGEKVKTVFERHFPFCFKRSTFYDHRNRWDAASFDAKQRVLDAGRTPAGLWSSFMSSNRASRAQLKAARKRASATTFIDLTLENNTV